MTLGLEFATKRMVAQFHPVGWRSGVLIYEPDDEGIGILLRNRLAIGRPDVDVRRRIGCSQRIPWGGSLDHDSSIGLSVRDYRSCSVSADNETASSEAARIGYSSAQARAAWAETNAHSLICRRQPEHEMRAVMDRDPSSGRNPAAQSEQARP